MKGTQEKVLDNSKLWTIQQVADFLQVHVWTVQQWIAHKDCPGVLRVGRVIRIQPAALFDWLHAQGTSSKA